MVSRSTVAIGAVVAAVSLAACTPVTTGGSEAGAVVGTEFERDGTTGTHYADCSDTAGQRYRVVVPGDVEYALHQGDPCPPGQRLPMPNTYGMENVTQGPWAYEGGDINSDCGSWSTDDADTARKLLAECPPLTKGHLP